MWAVRTRAIPLSGGWGMGSIVFFRRPVASRAVIEKLVALGYLQQAKRHRASAIERAIERLRRDLCRDGVIWDGDLSRGNVKDQPGMSLARASRDGSA
jgi:hypothetical protein